MDTSNEHTPRPWTAPHHGVQHAGEYGLRSHWCTVADYGSFAALTLWAPGCGFSPSNRDMPSAEAAREAGEQWLRDHAPQ